MLRSLHSDTSILAFSFSLFLLNLATPVHPSKLICSQTSECEVALRPGSECIEGYCTNPLHKGGCLSTLLPDWDDIRICNSLDPPGAEAMGYCRQSPLNYPEIRIFPNNWESPHVITWMLQIILSELLQTPVSVEPGGPGRNSDLYNINSRYEPATANVFYPLENSMNDMTCLAGPRDSNDYKACAHLIPEMYAAYWSHIIPGLEESEVIEAPIDNGFVGQDGLYIPFRTAVRNPSFLSYLGLRELESRREVAESFLAPTTWGDYCSLVVPNNCTEPNEVAARAPETDEEKASFFSHNLFRGHFRKDFLNDCDLNPDCKGFFLDYPCEWGVNTHQKLVHLDLPLQPTQFSYSELVQIMAAANATQSDIIHWWWYPEPMNQVYEGTEAQFTPLFLPMATSECLAARTNYSSGVRCEVDPIVAAGPEEGACEDPAQNLKKILATTLRQLSQNPDVPPELWSPAYEVITAFHLSNAQVGEVFKLWQARDNVDKWNYDLRDATCQWVVENMDFIKTLVPDTFPRATRDISYRNARVIHTITVAVAAAALLLLLATLVAVNLNKNKVAVYHAQSTILSMCLLGLLLYTCGALLGSMDATDVTCGSSVWFLNIGYVLAILPLLAKLDAINRGSVGGANRMQRIRLSGQQIVRPLAFVCPAVAAYLLVWSVLDNYRQMSDYRLSSETSDRGETIVHVASNCGSDLRFWVPAVLLWRAGLVLWGLILGLLASRNRDQMNGVNTMVMLFFSQAVFIGIQACIYFLESVLDYTSQVAALASSIEGLLFVSIYIWPKLQGGESQDDSDEPLPDLFLHTTIMMGDIVGFTKWSSMREPTEVFKLLEAIFSDFDSIAGRLGVLKVETVADCYVAAAGIPEARKDHAVIMLRFAWECLCSIKRLVGELEVTYGPDTGDLTLRIGLHSGAVTGGFLRGSGNRFQLFGDVMNVCGRMESCGAANMIHFSEATAEALRLAGKSSWVARRPECVHAKGKGLLQTYWAQTDAIQITATKRGPKQSTKEDSKERISEDGESKKSRLVTWNVEVLGSFLKEIIAARRVCGLVPGMAPSQEFSLPSFSMPLMEVKEIIAFPEFNGNCTRVSQEDIDKVKLSSELKDELFRFVTDIADMYRDNPFHSFGHASQVVLAVKKYMSRIVAPHGVVAGGNTARDRWVVAGLQEVITSDPLTQFACIFAALIHDLDHPGVPNVQYSRENESLAAAYQGRSLAEQNSLDIAWDLFLEYPVLRSAVCATQEEHSRFRQLVVNAVMATDLADKELKDLRNKKWQHAFSNGQLDNRNSRDAINRRVTIVIEHLIQASDVAHMHWHVYRQWNENLFREMYAAYKAGRSEKNPADYWYEGEIGFFDFYVIPLSQKLKDCGVFGVSSGENLSYAKSNRDEWVQRGKEEVAEMVDKLEREEDQGSPGAALAVKLEKRSHRMGKGGLPKHTTDVVKV